MNHANETWHVAIVDTVEPCAAVYIRNDTAKDCRDDIELGGLIDSEYAIRSVKCVNACKGVANPAALPELVEAVLMAIEFMPDCVHRSMIARCLTKLRG